MKKHLLVGLLGLFAITSCGPHQHTDSEIQSLLIGQWNYSSSFEKTEGDMKTSITSQGKVTFSKDGAMVSDGDTILTILLPEGSVPVEYKAVVYGSWFIEDHILHTSRASEEITAKNAVSEKFINDERMKKLRSETPTTFVTNFELISPSKIEASRPDGTHITYVRGN